jgi:glycosyltransferase involved in cell wall biosynthesis
VLIVQRRLPHYRVPFFNALRDELAQRGCSLRFAHGEPTKAERKKNDGGELGWAIKLPTRYFFGGRLCWQPFSSELADVDLVIATQENKLINNLRAQFFPQKYKFALWGHGANLQGDPTSWRERFKRFVSMRADWWFAYTEMSLPLLARIGFPRERISVLNNSVDTSELAAMRKKSMPAELSRLRQELALQGKHVGVYVGSLYAEKRIEFMLSAALKIKDALPDFEFLILGAGPQQALVEDFCQGNPWTKFLGLRKGQAKVDVMALAHVMINPGAVGLGILDAFVCGVPLVTSDCGLHGPEIAYLSNGENGLMTSHAIAPYATAVVNLFKDESALARLQQNCAIAANKYTIENMARNFADGVMECLHMQPHLHKGKA